MSTVQPAFDTYIVELEPDPDTGDGSLRFAICDGPDIDVPERFCYERPPAILYKYHEQIVIDVGVSEAPPDAQCGWLYEPGWRVRPDFMETADDESQRALDRLLGRRIAGIVRDRLRSGSYQCFSITGEEVMAFKKHVETDVLATIRGELQPETD